MIIQIEPQSDIPIYTQITNQIIEGIARGYLHPGDSLPSVRAFAGDLGVNMHTVNKSYHELEKKGIIRVVPKSGAVINFPNEMGEKNCHFERISSQFQPVIAEALVLGIKKEEIEKLVSAMIQDFKGKS
ncbi:GntR family transcriptional regulator [Neobacillus massiliamazoniensis]|jgi:GntR family transcriptional regulator|uniref:GntR family transcriptional regulator n=1 Tax=Neobacillus massiliamazoniensis TaxID=1499688 RepID=A0A0U1NWH6_9BACI|nr:GntR family transcriptional regulator [Neobacillus massiliamazoniensis]CRK82364.1 GntR family transcriptional regulator [Neobacillus massiliamazoniensis]